MARRALNKKEFQLNKEDEASSRHVTKILWSRDRYESFSDQEFIHNMGESLSESERSASSCSWGFDEYEIKLTKRIQSSLDAIEEALYEGNRGSLTSELYNECQKWAQRFPYLRLKGEEGVLPNIEAKCDELKAFPNNQLFSPRSEIESEEPFVSTSSSPDQEVSPPIIYSSIVVEDIEEIIAEDGNYQNIPDTEKSNKSCDTKNEVGGDINSASGNSPSPDYISEKVIELLASQIWSEVSLKWGKPRDSESSNSEGNDCLPPITASKDLPLQPTFQRPWTRGKTPKTSDFPKLDGILTVSPKVLQKRSDSRIGSGTERTRPNTGVSVMSYSSVGSFHNLNVPKRTIKSREKASSESMPFQSVQKRLLEKDVDFLNVYLPVLEENCPMLNSSLFSDLKIKDSFSKLRFPEASSFPVKPTFLPPIDDREVIPVGLVQQDPQRPISYESHLPNSKRQNQSNIYTRHLNKISARPSTTRTSWDMRNSNFDVKKHKDTALMENHSILSISSKKLPTDNVDNLVTLFPIVTALEPKQPNDRFKNKNFNRKNSLLGAFHQKEKR